MRTKIRSVHYCDFCDRRKFFKPAMIRHESGCTMNPNRKCRMCEIAGNEQFPLNGAKESFSLFNPEQDHDESAALAINSLRLHFQGCPACMLAALRQIENAIPYDAFKFKDECKKFWKLQRYLRPEDYYPAYGNY